MDREQRRAWYLAKAKHADESAKAASDPETREKWNKLADGFRQLARTT